MKTLLGWLNNTGLFVGGLSVVFLAPSHCFGDSQRIPNY